MGLRCAQFFHHEFKLLNTQSPSSTRVEPEKKNQIVLQFVISIRRQGYTALDFCTN